MQEAAIRDRGTRDIYTKCARRRPKLKITHEHLGHSRTCGIMCSGQQLCVHGSGRWELIPQGIPGGTYLFHRRKWQVCIVCIILL